MEDILQMIIIYEASKIALKEIKNKKDNYEKRRASISETSRAIPAP